MIDPKLGTGDTITSPAGVDKNKTLHIDGTTDTVTLAFAGYKPRISILDPRKKPYTGYDIVTNTDSAKVNTFFKFKFLF